MYFSNTFIIFFAASIGVLATSPSCSPVASDVHESFRCRQPSADGGVDFDHDCCAGKSTLLGSCTEGYSRTTTKSCGHGHTFCDQFGCMEYLCTKSTSCVVYVGCYKDKKDLPNFKYKSKNVPSKRYASGFRVSAFVSECSNDCRRRNYSFAAVQGADTCWCGDANWYAEYGGAEDQSCGWNKSKKVAMSCGDGNAQTCTGVNAVYKLKGTENCCTYDSEYANTPTDTSRAMAGFVWAYLIYMLIVIGCVLFWFCTPCLIGVCIWCCHLKEQKRRNEIAQAQAVANAKIIPANQNAGLPTVVYDQL